MSRLFRFLLLLAGAGALIAAARHLSRRSREQQQPFFADAHTAPAPTPAFVAPEPIAEAVVVQEPVVAEEPIVAPEPSYAAEPVIEPVAEAAPVMEPVVMAEMPVVEAAPVMEPVVVAEEPVVGTEPVMEPFVADEPSYAAEPVMEPVAADEPSYAAEPLMEPVMAEEAVVEAAPVLFDQPAVVVEEEVVAAPELMPLEEPAAVEPVWQAEEAEVDSFVADDSVRGPFALEDDSEEAVTESVIAAPAEDAADAWFVADVQEPAAQDEPAAKTDTWSGRAIGS